MSPPKSIAERTESAKLFAQTRKLHLDELSNSEPAPEGFIYRQHGIGDGKKEWRQSKSLLTVGAVSVVEVDRMHFVIDRCGLSFASFKKASNAKRLARAIGKRTDEFFDRCEAGSFTAMDAIRRVCCLHVRAARIKEAVDKSYRWS